MSTVRHHQYSVEQYLSLERDSNVKHEYYRGEIFAMVGATPRHGRIVTNLTVTLANQLRDRPCDVFSTDIRLHATPADLYTYPDVMVVCDGQGRKDDAFEAIESPAVIVEVLSPSTEEYDRGAKFELYQAMASLTDYLLVRQDACHVEHRERQADGQWLTHEYTDLDGTITLSLLGCKLPLREIYPRAV